MRRLICLLIVGAGVALVAHPAPHAAAGQAVHVIQIDNQIINPITASYITKAIDRAEAEGALCLVIELDTPGGLLESTRTIIKRMFSANVPLVAYVSPSGARAGSAGVFITLASHVAVMAPTTNIGAAHPVSGQGGGPVKKLIKRFQENQEKQERPSAPFTPFGRQQSSKKTPASRDAVTEEVTESSPMDEKILHDTLAWVSTIAKSRGRNETWARQSVEDSASITADEALALNVIDIIAKNTTDMLEQLHGRTVELPSGSTTLDTTHAVVTYVPLTQRQRILLILTNPTVAYLLMMLGFWGLVTEVTHPGLGFPGVAGAICLVLALFAFQTLPINYAGVVLILIGIALFVAEVNVMSYGLLTLGGVTCLMLGSLMLIDSPHDFMQVSLRVVVPIVVTTTALALLLVGAAVRVHKTPVTTGRQGMIGEVGTAHTDLSPEGQVFIHGEVWSATATQPVQQGTKIRVIKLDRLTVTVEPV